MCVCTEGVGRDTAKGRELQQKSELIALFDKLELPHVVCETHFIISSDMQHDNAMIQKLLNDHIIPYIKKAAPGVTMLDVRSDGCKAQFKCAANFYWVSRQKVEGCGLEINWSFFESCHGKVRCWIELGLGLALASLTPTLALALTLTLTLISATATRKGARSRTRRASTSCTSRMRRSSSRIRRRARETT